MRANGSPIPLSAWGFKHGRGPQMKDERPLLFYGSVRQQVA